jgi:hypothetical protein
MGELGCPYDMADALGVAEGLHEYFRQTDIIKMAFYAQTVNVIGAIKTSRTAAQMETTGLILSMYRAHFGEKPLKIADEYAPLDIAAAITADGKIADGGRRQPDGGLDRTLPQTRLRSPQGAGRTLDGGQPRRNGEKHARQAPQDRHRPHGRHRRREAAGHPGQSASVFVIPMN